MSTRNEHLLEARRSYESGDFKSARRLAKAELSRGDLGDGDRNEAQRILAATGIDPMAVLIFAATTALLAYLVFRYVL